MGATATLSTTRLSVEAGDEITCAVVVRNSGGVVDQFAVEVVGQPGAWATVEPAVVNLVPQEATTVTIRFAPPRSAAVPAGSAPFGVRVSSQEDPEGSVVEEGVIEVGAFAELTAEVVPPKVEAAARGKYRVALDNRGNYPVAVRLEAADPEGELDFRFRRNELVLEPDTTEIVRLLAKPRDRFLRGQPVRHRFQVALLAAERPPVTAEATLVQRQLLPKWLVPALIAVAAAALVIAGLWWTVLRPAVRSAATDAAARQAAEVKQVAEQARQQADAAKQDSGQAKQNSESAMRELGLTPPGSASGSTGGTSGGGAASGGSSTGGGGRAVTPPSTPTDFRIAANARSTTNNQSFVDVPYNSPADKTLVITDAILQNPRGDAGTLRIVRGTGSGNQVLLEVGLGNFRDLDEHWVEPLRIRPGERILISVSCQNPSDKGNCTPAVTFSGRVEG